MSRSTQYIGLTTKAKQYVDNLKPLLVKSTTWGMFSEDISLGVWTDESGRHFCMEFVQVSPWSSGPMLFTALCGPNGVLEWSLWKESKKVKGQEYDPDKGLFWV